MTIDDTAREVFDDINIDRNAARVAAKAIAQQIIDESASTDKPLQGLVYDVWSLYNEGEPQCAFSAPYEDKRLVFTGTFEKEGESEPVERRSVLTQSEVLSLLRELKEGPDARA
jgi:hypothetical protein